MMDVNMVVDVGQLLIVSVGALLTWGLRAAQKTVHNAIENAEKVPELEKSVVANRNSIKGLYGVTAKQDKRLDELDVKTALTEQKLNQGA